MSELARKSVLEYAKLNLHGQGVLLKKIPIPLLKRLALYESAAQNNANSPAPGQGDQSSNAKVKRAVQRLNEEGVTSLVRQWARGGLEDTYLSELVEGLPFVKHGTCLIAYKATGNNQSNFRPLGFILYGTFDPLRKAKDGVDTEHQWWIDISGVNSDDADAGNIAEIEGVITANNDAEAKGVGKAMFEYALGDLLSRKKKGQPRYSHVLLFTEYQKMRDLCIPYGFTRKPYVLRDFDSADTNITSELVNEYEVASDPQISKCFTLNVDVKINTVLNRTKDRIVKSKVCPITLDETLKYWMKCKL